MMLGVSKGGFNLASLQRRLMILEGMLLRTAFGFVVQLQCTFRRFFFVSLFDVLISFVMFQ